MRCTVCNKSIIPKWNKELGEWEVCNTCKAKAKERGFYAYDNESFQRPEDNERTEKEKEPAVLQWNYSKGPRPDCLDWSDGQIIDSLCRQLDDMKAKEKPRKLTTKELFLREISKDEHGGS